MKSIIKLRNKNLLIINPYINKEKFFEKFIPKHCKTLTKINLQRRILNEIDSIIIICVKGCT